MIGFLIQAIAVGVIVVMIFGSLTPILVVISALWAFSQPRDKTVSYTEVEPDNSPQLNRPDMVTRTFVENNPNGRDFQVTVSTYTTGWLDGYNKKEIEVERRQLGWFESGENDEWQGDKDDRNKR